MTTSIEPNPRQQVILDPRYCGPPQSANGGYACGVVASAIEGPAAVSLRRRPPLGRPLELERREGGMVALLDGETLIAEGGPASLEVEPPAPVTLAQAEAASQRFAFFDRHPFPGCFVCGPARHDGLRLFPGPVFGRELHAAPWTPDTQLAERGGRVRREFVWAALDCPSSFVLHTDRACLLARLAARIDGTLNAAQTYVLVAWRLADDGRKHHSASAIYNRDGNALALARALWIEQPTT